VAGYRIEARIGAGGMAVVYRARDERLPRLAALKVMAAEWAADASFRQRFIAEARAATAVDHPNVIPVYKAGEADGVLFIAMRLVSGGDLRDVLRQEGREGQEGPALPPGRALELLSPVASALDAAHAAGLVHRDVKPGNILIDKQPGRADYVYLSDFGLSKGALSGASLTRSGHYLGTPQYSAPEQAQGERVDGRADQYALACVAFELVTGRPPFERDRPLAVLLAHVTAPPPVLTERRPGLPAAADDVMARALAKAPADRYPSCQDFTDALRYALAGATTGPPRTPAPTRPPSPARVPAGGDDTEPAPDGTRRRRNRLLVIAGAAAALATAVTVSLALAATGTTNATPRTTTRPRVPTPTPSRTHSPSPGPASTPTPTASREPDPLVATLTDPAGGASGNNVLSVSFASDGTTVAAGDISGRIFLWNTATRKEIANLNDPRGKSIGRLAFAPGSNTTLAAGDGNGSTYLWNTTTKAIAETLTAPKTNSIVGLLQPSVSAIAYPPGGSPLAVADVYASTYLWNPASGTVDGTLPDPSEIGSVQSLAFAPDGTTLATGNFNGSITLWDIATRTVITTLTDPNSDGVQSLAFAPDGRTLAAANELGAVDLWDTRTRKIIQTFTNPQGTQGVTSVAFSPGGTALAAGDENGSVSVWLAASGTQTANFNDPGSEGVTSVAFSSGGTVLAAGDKNGSTYLWRVTRQVTS
jgi:serine/threonine-protein kinase